MERPSPLHHPPRGMTGTESDAGGKLPAWGRFLLRLAAIAWPLFTYWHIATARSGAAQSASCIPVELDVLLLGVTVVGTVGMVWASAIDGRPQRYVAMAATVLAGASIVIVAVVRWILPETSCGLF